MCIDCHLITDELYTTICISKCSVMAVIVEHVWQDLCTLVAINADWCMQRHRESNHHWSLTSVQCKWGLPQIVIGTETWVHHFEPESRWQWWSSLHSIPVDEEIQDCAISRKPCGYSLFIWGSYLSCYVTYLLVWHVISLSALSARSLSHVNFFCSVFCNSIMQLESIMLSFV